LRYLPTASGLIRAGAIDHIGPPETHGPQIYQVISYHVGTEARETRASVEAVETFLQAMG